MGDVIHKLQFVKMSFWRIFIFCGCYFKVFSEAIVGGKDAPLRKFSYQVSLQNVYGHFCGGSIISKLWILTAAHCIDEANMTVVTGTIYIDSGCRYSVKDIKVHERYSAETAANDIAVIKLENHIKFNKVTQPIKLAYCGPLPGKYATVTGWGFVDV